MKTLLTNLAHGPFDWIIIDTPPVLAVTDAVILAPMVTGVTFVVGAEMTRRRLAERAIETVMQSPAALRRRRAEQGRFRAEQVPTIRGTTAISTRTTTPKRRSDAPAAALPLLLLIGWTLVAFAGAYRWTTVPLCAGVALLLAVERPSVGGRPARVLDWSLLACLPSSPPN